MQYNSNKKDEEKVPQMRILDHFTKEARSKQKRTWHIRRESSGVCLPTDKGRFQDRQTKVC